MPHVVLVGFCRRVAAILERLLGPSFVLVLRHVRNAIQQGAILCFGFDRAAAAAQIHAMVRKRVPTKFVDMKDLKDSETEGIS